MTVLHGTMPKLVLWEYVSVSGSAWLIWRYSTAKIAIVGTKAKELGLPLIKCSLRKHWDLFPDALGLLWYDWHWQAAWYLWICFIFFLVFKRGIQSLECQVRVVFQGYVFQAASLCQARPVYTGKRHKLLLHLTPCICSLWEHICHTLLDLLSLLYLDGEGKNTTLQINHLGDYRTTK